VIISLEPASILFGKYYDGLFYRLLDDLLVIKSKFIYIISCLIFTTVLVGCSDPNNDYLQGVWYRGDVHYFDRWTFDRGSFTHQFEITPMDTNLVQGHYSVLDSQGDRITLELFDIQSTFEAEDTEILVVIDKQRDMIRITGKTYSRVFP
jgi:hypothetical protein